MDKHIPSPMPSLSQVLRFVAFFSVLGVCLSAEARASATLKRTFVAPPRQYSSGPLWVWNDMLSAEQIRSTMQDLADQKVKQVFVHPRPGLMTPYLSDEWFRLWDAALEQAERLDMNVWIYDENSYPSGFAGGLVPDAMPESRGKGLSLSEAKTPPSLDDNIVAVFKIRGDTYENITQKIRDGNTFDSGRYLVASIRLARQSGWFGGKWYVDLLKPGVTEKFIEVTMEAYRRELGEHFGKRVPGWFTDEPHLAPAGGLHWSDHLPELFERRWGYSLIDHLPELVRPVGDWKRVRHNYYCLLLEQFIEMWAKPCYAYCEKHNLDFTGHYWEHGWPGAGHGGDNMAMYAWHQRPAIDTLMNRYSEGVHAQFGNVRAVKELSSVANQLGRTRTLCEAYGAGGWDLRFEDMKRIGDWLYVLGVNTMNEHLSYITIRGARKRDHPQSFSYHEPWWDAYHVMAEYFTRLSLIMSQGRQINHILVLEPTTSTWMYQGSSNPADQLGKIGNSFQSLLMSLEHAQVEYDIGCEDIISRNGSVEGSEFRVGERIYDTVVLPPFTENLDSETFLLIEKYLRAGGKVLCCGEAPVRIDGCLSDRTKSWAGQAGWQETNADRLVEVLQAHRNGGFAIDRKAGDRGILFHHRRVDDDGEFLFLANTSIERPTAGTIESNMRGIEAWDLNTGKTEAYPFRKIRKGLRADFRLAPCGSLLLFLSENARKPAPVRKETVKLVPTSGAMEIRREQPNVLTLDYVDVTVGGETRKNVYFYAANRLIWQKHGMDRNPWDSAVQFKDELITKTWPTESGFRASYRFTIEENVPANLSIVIERTDLYSITCNGSAVSAEPGAWWLDKCFGKIDIADEAVVGENLVTITAQPFTIYHELESAYVLGDFVVEPADQGFVILPDKPLEILKAEENPAHSIDPDGTMWLSGGIGFGDGVEDRAPFVVFDLGERTDLMSLQIWNYNESNVRDLTSRGVKDLRILTSGDSNDDFDTDPRVVTLGRASENSPPQTAKVRASNVRFVKFEILSNHNGVTFPAEGTPPDNGFAGLAEVQFLKGDGTAVRDVQISSVSSELTSFRRTSSHLVDGSGLVDGRRGWKQQGHPFYAAGVSYRQTFDVGEPAGTYAVKLPQWYGSVARVNVNGKKAGYIVSPPWQCDVTDHIESRDNAIEVVVIGTLRNTLGPHHQGALTGSAWPAMFQRAPEHGPPPGSSYHMIDYGLFEPFELTQITIER